MKRAGFIMLPYEVFDSPAYNPLTPLDQAILVLLIRKHNGRNNGDIPLGVREITKRCRVGKATALRALSRLQQSGLVERVRKGHLVPVGDSNNVASRWRVTFITETRKESK